VTEIARRLPALHQRDVQEVLDVLLELWRIELARADGEIRLRGLGTLHVEVHPLRASGITRQALLRRYGQNAPSLVPRRTIRFRPYDALRQAVREEAEDHE
jgi:nucleoid DNA-binding protein